MYQSLGKLSTSSRTLGTPSSFMKREYRFEANFRFEGYETGQDCHFEGFRPWTNQALVNEPHSRHSPTLQLYFSARVKVG
jgi:hypothetical protein